MLSSRHQHCPSSGRARRAERCAFSSPPVSQAQSKLMPLDPSQRRAATCDAPIQLTLAGPGSGKTSTLTGRFIHLVRQGVDPRRILAVTFTKKAVEEMRQRIYAALPDLPPKQLEIFTFHGFAYRCLRRNPVAAGLPSSIQLWDTPQ